ncbi:MAG TPA: DUF6185 family protein, partial [Anaerolineales bacterium]|nr:DUF6185 family protein [Anaerolineales bacterium]
VTPLQRLFAGFIDPYSVINTINFILSLIFVFLLFHILSPGHAKQESVFPVEARRLVRILYPLVLMLIILQLLFVSRSLFSLFSTTTSMEGWQKAANISFGLERAYGFYSVLSLVMFTLVATWQTRRRRTLGQLALWFLGVLLGAALAFPSGYSLFQLMGSRHHIALFSEAVLNYAGGVFEYTSLEQLPLSTILFIGYGVLIFGFTIFILAGFRQLLLDVMPGISLTQVTTRFHWTGRTTAWTFALLALAITTQWVFVRFQRMNPADWERLWIDFLIEEYAGSFASQLFALLPLFILAGVTVLLYHAGWSEDSPLVSTALQWCIPLAALMFGEFVSNTYLKVAGFSIPFGILIGFWALPYFLDTKLKRLQEWIDSKNSGGRHHKKLALLANREEFLERAKALEDLEAKNDSIYRDYTRNSIDRETYHKQKQELQAQMKWIEAGGPNTLRAAKDQYLKIRGESLLRLPDFVSPRDLALSLGPAENWWQNGLLAAKFGLILSILPVGYFLYVLIVFRAKIILSTGSFGVIYLFKDLLFEIAFWLVAAFIMGMLYPYLRGRNGVIKGAFLGGVYGLVAAATVLLQTILNLGTRTNWLFPTLQLLLFWIILGVLLDRSTLNKYGLYWREIIDLYNLQDTRVLLGYLSPLALSLLGLAQQIISGAASASILTEVIKGISSALPNLP